ncbi:Squamosa promoter-binding-like protein 9 [Nymphaea thermarum]|nr:Squamosa promoter-binding-like protein 9 [Nymphaea thermarum]
MEAEGVQEESGVLASSAGGWEWGSLLDFSIDDDSTLLSWDSQQDQEPEQEQEQEQEQRQQQQQPPAPSASTQPAAGLEKGASQQPRRGDPVPLPSEAMSNRIRKRDPRLTCANFMAGRVPCACPEVDDKGEETMTRKRAKTAVRCQVPGCEADITELKGYHRRHRVCLRCAYAPTVTLDGHLNRYCQQCGKFHLLSDFDEGKRSCRRKLERHNHRRRRKSDDCKSGTEVFQPLEGGTTGTNLVEDNDCDDETGKEKPPGESCGADSFQINELSMDKGRTLESEDVLGSPFSSAAGQINPSFQNIPSESIPSCTTSGGAHKEVVKASRSTISSSFYDNKSAYSSVCPTGRVSFKLYDWNPAEFPRRLRHQIFQWLASMPVELEGYIRPGCTILTAFIAMPQPMWNRLSEDAVAFVNALVNAPQSLLSGRGSLLIYLNDSIFQLMKDGSSIINIKAKMQAPRLHYVHPICFEAGKPMEFIACGRNLVQPRLRFLISFSGRYLRYECCEAFSVAKSACKYEMDGDDGEEQNYQIFKVRIPETDTGLYGPAFIEVSSAVFMNLNCSCAFLSMSWKMGAK